MKAEHLSVCLALVLITACTAESPISLEQEKTPTSKETARVDLPALLPLEGSLPPETHPDGKLRVDGLLVRRGKHLGKKVIVRGYLVEKYECPKEAKRCVENHGYLADTPAGGEKKLLLVDFDDRVRDALVVGESYVVKGKFATESSTGFVTSRGLLIYEQIEGLELPPEPENGKKKPR